MEDKEDISKQGYKDNSPYKESPYLDIETTNGIIDMTDVSIPLLANNIVLGPNSGLHKFDTPIVREIPLAQTGFENLYKEGGSLPKAQAGFMIYENGKYRKEEKQKELEKSIATYKRIESTTEMTDEIRNLSFLGKDILNHNLGKKLLTLSDPQKLSLYDEYMSKSSMVSGAQGVNDYIDISKNMDLREILALRNDSNITQEELRNFVRDELIPSEGIMNTPIQELLQRLAIGQMEKHGFKYGGSVKQSPYDKEKLALKNQDGIIADMMRNGAFLPKFKMGAEKNIDLPDGNKYKIKKEFDKLRELPFIGVKHNDIDDRVYYDKDDKDGSGNFNIIDVAQQDYDQRREHQKTKELIKKHNKGETLSHTALIHLANLGLVDPKKIKDPIVETLSKPPPVPEVLSLEELDVSKDIKNVTLDGENFVPIDDQIGMYMAYVSNKYKDTPYAKKLKRIYDKLNRVYYNDSKNSGLSIIEYMKSLSNN